MLAERANPANQSHSQLHVTAHVGAIANKPPPHHSSAPVGMPQRLSGVTDTQGTSYWIVILVAGE
jgi:hypothetical protein